MFVSRAAMIYNCTIHRDSALSDTRIDTSFNIDTSCDRHMDECTHGKNCKRDESDYNKAMCEGK